MNRWLVYLFAMVAGVLTTLAMAEPLRGDRPVAVLPVVNRSGNAAPLSEVRSFLASKLTGAGLSILDQEVLDEFMRRHRMRYIGGINRRLALALEEETGAQAVVITSLDLFKETGPAQAALTARIVSTGDDPRILWMDSASGAGDESPGLLGLGLVDDVDVILARLTARLSESAAQRLVNTAKQPGPRNRARAPRRFRPKVSYSSAETEILEDRTGPIAVLPFANTTPRRFAGAILTDQLVLHLADAGLNVIEPGVVRQKLLEARHIQPKGPSVPQVDLLRAILSADLILFGEVAEYREGQGGVIHPVLDFSFRVIDTDSRLVIWSSISHNQGDDGVFFFDAGRVATAPALASSMAQALVAKIRRSRPEKGNLR